MRLDDESTPKPIYILPICSHTIQNLSSILITIINSFEINNPDATLIDIGTDGDKFRRKLFNSLRRININFEKFNRMQYFDSWAVMGKLGVNFDWKHETKRVRGILISQTRSITLIKHSISRNEIELLLPHLKHLMNPSDYQNVPAAVKLLQGLKDIDNCTIKINEATEEIKKEIKLLSIIVEYLLNAFTYTKINLDTQLIALSTLSFLLFYIYLKHKSKFLTKDLYMDIQTSILSAFNQAILYQKHNPDAPLYVYRSGTDDVELLFGILRTLTHGPSFDLFEMLQRLKTVCQIQKIYSRNEEWKKNKRLDIVNTCDHSSYSNWTGNLTTRDLSLDMIWEIGHDKAKDHLINSGYSMFELAYGGDFGLIKSPIG